MCQTQFSDWNYINGTCGWVPEPAHGAAVGSAEQSSAPLGPTAAFWGGWAFFPKQASHEWPWKEGRPYLCKSERCWGYVGGVSPAASLKTSWEVVVAADPCRYRSTEGIVQDRRVGVAACERQSCWNFLGTFAHLKGLMLVSYFENSCLPVVISWFYCN